MQFLRLQVCFSSPLACFVFLCVCTVSVVSLHLFCFVLCLYYSSELIHLNSNSPFFERTAPPLCPVRSLAWASDPAGPTFFFFFKKNKRNRKRFMIFWHIYFKVWIFFYVVKKISISYLEYPVFDTMWQIYICIKKMFLVCCIQPIP